jgi:hypothetical protein
MRWLDWEESWRGPIGWDLASMDHRRRVFGELDVEIGRALEGYGPHDEDALEAWAPVVALWAAAWGVAAADRTALLDDRTTTRLAWLEARLDA